MSSQVVNWQGDVVRDKAAETERATKVRTARNGEPFTATADCPWCGHLAVHWLDTPRLRSEWDDSPAGRTARMVDRLAYVSLCASGPPKRHYDSPGTIVARVCVACGYRWGQS